MDGSLTRWRDPIPKDAPSPYEVKKVEQTVRSRARAVLFGEVTEATEDMVDDAAGDNEKELDVDLDDDMDMDDDFVVDDLGGGMLDDEPELDRWKGEGVREMGKASGKPGTLSSCPAYFLLS
jgi:chromosome transmission fidelity protein 4